MIELEIDVDDIVRYYSKTEIEDSLRLAKHMYSISTDQETKDYWFDQRAKLGLAKDISEWSRGDYPIRVDLVVKGMQDELLELRGNYHWLTQQVLPLKKEVNELSQHKRKYTQYD